MANRYWVGGSGNWTSSSTFHWSDSSGGANGASVPTSADDVFFNSSSGGGTVTLQFVNANAQSLNFTGFTGTLALRSSGTLNIYGSLTFGSAMGLDPLGATAPNILGSGTIISNGKSLSTGLTINAPGGTVTLGDALFTDIDLYAGTFNTANFSVSNGFSSSTIYGTRALNMGSSTWTANYWSISTSGMTFNAGTSTINVSGSTFNGGNLTYNVVAKTNTSVLTIGDSNTFNTISNSTQPVTFKFKAGTTQTVTNFNLSGTAGNLVTISSNTAGTQATLSKPSGVANPQYLSIQDINATGGAAWNAQYSTDAGNNTGWNFGSAFAALL